MADITEVKEGDTLAAIAKKKGVSLGELIAANPQISNPNQIWGGQSIRVPSAGQVSEEQAQAGLNKMIEAGPARGPATYAEFQAGISRGGQPPRPPGMPLRTPPEVPVASEVMAGTSSMLASTQPAPVGETGTDFDRIGGPLVRLTGGYGTSGLYGSPAPVETADRRFRRGVDVGRNTETVKAVNTAFQTLVGDAQVGDPGFLTGGMEDPFVLGAIANETGLRPFEVRQILTEQEQIRIDQGVRGRDTAPSPGGTLTTGTRPIANGEGEIMPIMDQLGWAAGYTNQALLGGYDPATGTWFDGAMVEDPETGKMVINDPNLLPILMTPELAFMIYGEGSEDFRIKLGYNPEWPYELLEKKPQGPSGGYSSRYGYGRGGGGGRYGRGGGFGSGYSPPTPLVMWRIGP